MSDHDDRLERVRCAADELLPQLTERLARHRLGELEVREGELRVRVAGSPAAPPMGGADAQRHGAASLERSRRLAAAPVDPGRDLAGGRLLRLCRGARPGTRRRRRATSSGTSRCSGVRHDVRAPRGGTVRNLVTEAGEPVEYGQLLVELEPAG